MNTPLISVIIPTLAIFLFMVHNYNYNATVKIKKIPQFAFISSLLIGFFEAFLTEAHDYMFFVLFLIIFVKKSQNQILIFGKGRN